MIEHDIPPGEPKDTDVQDELIFDIYKGWIDGPRDKGTYVGDCPEKLLQPLTEPSNEN
jgi:hypothetical protein